jgi:hypothetical protein
VINKLTTNYAPLTGIQPREVPQLVAGRILAVGGYLIAPISGRPVVHYRVVAEELQTKTRMVQNADGNGEHAESYQEWVQMYGTSAAADVIESSLR